MPSSLSLGSASGKVVPCLYNFTIISNNLRRYYALLTSLTNCMNWFTLKYRKMTLHCSLCKKNFWGGRKSSTCLYVCTLLVHCYIHAYTSSVLLCTQGLNNVYNACSVNGSKRTLLYQAEEGAKLEAENKDLHFRIAQLKESHAWVVDVHDTVQLNHMRRYLLTYIVWMFNFWKMRWLMEKLQWTRKEKQGTFYSDLCFLLGVHFLN